MASSTSRTLYQRYMQVITRWPLDPLKEGRDLGVRIRDRVTVLFPQGELTQLDNTTLQSVNKEIEALEKITNNANKNRYLVPPEEQNTATGLATEQLHRITSSYFVNALNEASQASLFTRVKYQLTSMFK